MDMSRIRRGHQVYQQVCASCHSMSLISYRDLVGVAYTEEETKAMAAKIEVILCVLYRQCLNISYFQARHNGQNYVFSLLTGYRDPPAGVTVILYPPCLILYL